MAIERYAVKSVVSVAPDHTLARAIETMRGAKVGSVVVVQDGRPVGMLTDRDAALAVHARGNDPERTRVDAAMQSPVVTARGDAGVREAIRTLADHGLRRLPIVDQQDKLAGLLAIDDLLLVLARELFLLRSPLVAQRPKVAVDAAEPAMRKLREHYQGEVVTVAPEATAAEIARAMEHHAVGAVVVVDSEQRPLGIVTDRDLLARAAGLPDSRAAVANALMSSPVATIEASADLEAVLHLMQKHSIRRVPVVDGGRLVGIVTLDDLLVLLGREIADLGVAIRHSIERSRRAERLADLRTRLHETIDWSLDRAAALGEKAQEHLSRDFEAIREQLRKRLS
jgi:CBS domain-containing protein